MGWLPRGHPPPGVYDIPHFDFHFYMISAAQRRAIPPGPDPVEPDPRYVPADYATDGMAVPEEGVHWSDALAPEFNGEAFTRTFVYGFHGGDLIFVEPMVTKAFLETSPSVAEPIRQPDAYQRSGAYPTEYAVEHDAANRQYDIALRGFVQRAAS